MLHSGQLNQIRLTEDDLHRKMIFDRRRPLTKDNLWWKTTFDGRWPSIGIQYINWKRFLCLLILTATAQLTLNRISTDTEIVAGTAGTPVEPSGLKWGTKLVGIHAYLSQSFYSNWGWFISWGSFLTLRYLKPILPHKLRLVTDWGFLTNFLSCLTNKVYSQSQGSNTNRGLPHKLKLPHRLRPL